MEVRNDIYIRVEGRVGRITLTRPQALNAVNQPIVDAMTEALLGWQDSDAIGLVLVDAEGEMAFSAGGDLAFVYRHGKAGDIETPNRFWRDEYRLNALISRYEKPYVAIMDGIVMGGGVGLSAHGSHRIVTEGSMVAMPECAVGLVTDVGGSRLLRQAPGSMGEYLGLTGHRMKGEDAIHAGFADIYVHRARLDDLKAALVEGGDVAVLDRFAEAPPPSDLATHQQAIDAIFSAPTLPEILESRCRRIGLGNQGEDCDHLRLAAVGADDPGDDPRCAIDGDRTAQRISFRQPCAAAGRFPRGHPRHRHRQGSQTGLAPQGYRIGAGRAHRDDAARGRGRRSRSDEMGGRGLIGLDPPLA